MLPPAKRKKKQKLETLCFLDCFPKDVLDSVMRFLSGMPYAQNWQTHIEVRNLLQLFAVSGAFGSYVKSRFKALCINLNTDSFLTECSYGWMAQTEPHLLTDDIDVALAFIRAGGGESLQTLVIHSDLFRAKSDGEDLLNEILKLCPNVKSFGVEQNDFRQPGLYDSSWALLSERQLEKLEVGRGIPFDFPLHSNALRELTLNTWGDSDITSANMWEKIGASLERFCITADIRAPNGLDTIKKNCPNLKSIHMEGQERKDVAAVAALLASYGDNLEYAYLSDMNMRQLKKLPAVCPNARFHLNAFQDLTVARLNLIAPRLEAMTLCELKIKEDKDSIAEWKNAWSKCINLRELYTYHLTLQELEIIFSTRKEQLKVFQLFLHENMNVKDTEKVMEVCAEGTRCVEAIKYSGLKFNNNNLEKFFETNRASLSSIKVFQPSYEAGNELDQLLDSVLKLPALNELHLECEMPRKILKTLEKRGVYWKRDPNS